MPLIKSKSDKAFKSNIKAEIAAGKPQKQAVAIAYATKRAAKKAVGGRMSTNPHDYDSDVDYYKAIGDPRGNEDDPEEQQPAPTRAQNLAYKAEQNLRDKYFKKNKEHTQRYIKAKESGDKKALEKAEDRWSKHHTSETLRLKAKRPIKAEDADKARKEWSEKIGKGKPAPFKKGGKVCW